MAILEELAALQHRMDTLPGRRAELINQARDEKHTWPEIAAVLGMTEHGARKAAKATKALGRPRSGG